MTDKNDADKRVVPIFKEKTWPKQWSKEQEAEWRQTLEELGYDK